METRAGFVEINGGRFHVEIAGDGPPTILIHGFACDMRMWDSQFETLAQSRRVLRYDLRGFGKSSRPDGPYHHGDDLAALLDHFDLPHPLLVGLSLGANIALNFAMRFPGNAAAIVLASPGLPGHNWQHQRPPEAVMAHAQQHGVAAGKRFWLEHPLFKSLDDFPEAKATTHAMVDDYSGWHWQNTDTQIPGNPVYDVLEDITAPTLVLSGLKDIEGYRQIAGVLSERLPHAIYQAFPDAGHMLNMEQADGFNAAILQFAGETGKVHGASARPDNG